MTDTAISTIPLLDSAPAWFRDSVAIEPDHHVIDVAGAPIHYAIWGRGRDKPTLVLAHGSAAHIRWFTFIAPFLADRWEVLVLELSGNGDSGWRPAYDVATRAEEILAVCADAGYFMRPEKPIMTGHSFGSVCAVNAVANRPDLFSALLLIDPPLFRPGLPYPRGDRVVKPNRIYASPEEALSRFRLDPVQPLEHDFVIDYIARWSLRPVPAPDGGMGWTWKFDPEIYAKAPKQDFAERLETLRGTPLRVGLIYGTRSPIVQTDRIGFIMEQFAGWGPVVPIPDAYHHLMLDQPRVFTTALRAMLTCWRIDDGK